MSDITSEFEELAARYLDGALTDADRDHFVEMLEADPTRVEELRAQLKVSGALARLRPDLSDDTFLNAVLPHLGSLTEEPEDAFAGRVRQRLRIARWQRSGLAIAAAVALGGGLALFLSRDSAGEGEVVAQIFEGGDSRPVRKGEKLALASGVSRMEFTNGAVIAIEAPASLSIRSADEVSLERGRLNAWCPETAHGFRVVTTSATLTDLGTSFGVSAADDGTADFLVLDGKVRVAKDGEVQTIEKGSALRARRGKRLSKVAFEPSPFFRTWPVASGINRTSGEVIPAPPGTPESLAAMEDDDQILVIPERRDLKLSEPLRVDIRKPGTYEADSLLAPEDFLPREGVKVRSYLLRYNPVGKAKAHTRRFEGSVTFDRPVLAIIAGSGKLNRSDELLSKAPLPKLNPKDSDLRGLERGQLPYLDRVTLSDDRRTITVTFYAGESIDEIRAITRDR